MKKALSVFLICLCLFSALAFPSSAQEETEKFALVFHSDLAGCTPQDRDRFIEVQSGHIHPKEPDVFVADCVGDVYFDALKPGRTYTVLYSFVMDDGYDCPEALDESNVSLTCDPGCSVYWYGISSAVYGDGIRRSYLNFHTTVTVDGTFFQRLFGKLADLFLKIRMWSPY